MISNKEKTVIETTTCESCGEDFSCGAKSEKCWCFEIDLKPKTLTKLRQDFKSCLCENCLSEYEIK